MNNSADYLPMCSCVGDFPPFLLLRERFHSNARETNPFRRKTCYANAFPEKLYVQRLRHADAASYENKNA